MDLSHLLRMPISVVHVTQDGPPDAMGDPTEQTTTSTFLGYVWQTGADEQTAGGQIEREDWQMALERRANGHVGAGDRVTASGQTFDVAGPPWPATNPRTLLIEYVHARLNRSA